MVINSPEDDSDTSSVLSNLDDQNNLNQNYKPKRVKLLPPRSLFQDSSSCIELHPFNEEIRRDFSQRHNPEVTWREEPIKDVNCWHCKKTVTSLTSNNYSPLAHIIAVILLITGGFLLIWMPYFLFSNNLQSTTHKCPRCANEIGIHEPAKYGRCSIKMTAVILAFYLLLVAAPLMLVLHQCFGNWSSVSKKVVPDIIPLNHVFLDDAVDFVKDERFWSKHNASILLERKSRSGATVEEFRIKLKNSSINRYHGVGTDVMLLLLHDVIIIFILLVILIFMKICYNIDVCWTCGKRNNSCNDNTNTDDDAMKYRSTSNCTVTEIV